MTYRQDSIILRVGGVALVVRNLVGEVFSMCARTAQSGCAKNRGAERMFGALTYIQTYIQLNFRKKKAQSF